MNPLTIRANGERGDPPRLPGPGDGALIPVRTAPDARPARMAELDVYRGVTILAVVLHHLTGLAIRHAAGSLLREGLMVLNRGSHFVVPAFLFLTALVLTRSALRRFHPGTYLRSRVQRVLVPYLFWTAAYVVFRVLSAQDPPSVLGDPERWRVWLQYGKGYFLQIALQFSLILPLLLTLFSRKPPFSWVLIGAGALQLLLTTRACCISASRPRWSCGTCRCSRWGCISGRRTRRSGASGTAGAPGSSRPRS